MYIKFKRITTIIISIMVLVILICILAYKPALSAMKDKALKWQLTTKIGAIAEVDVATRDLFVVPKLFEPVYPDVDIKNLPYEDYESVKDEWIHFVDEAKTQLALSAADFEEKAKFVLAVQNLHEINQRAITVGIPKTGMENMLNYVGRIKAAITGEAKSAALLERAITAKSVSEKAYLEAMSNYMSQKFAVDDLTAELDARMQKHLEELEAIRIAQEKAAEEARRREQEKQWQGVPAGASGRLRIPAYGISIPLYSGVSQGIVDASDSAAMFGLNGVTVIADHWNQNGFSAVRNMAVGTAVYIDYPGGSVAQYHVNYCGTGTNATTNLLFSDGTPVDARYGGLIMYTCLSNWQNVAIVCCG